MVDWTQTLAPASYRGVPFYVRTDNYASGRRIGVHEFPFNDAPFLEDLGQKPVTFDITGYLASDGVLFDEQNLRAAFEAQGAGTLIMPSHGAFLARAEDFRFDFAKDELGYTAFTCKFIRDTNAPALTSVNMLANLVFVGGDALVAAAGGLFAGLNFGGFDGLSNLVGGLSAFGALNSLVGGLAGLPSGLDSGLGLVGNAGALATNLAEFASQPVANNSLLGEAQASLQSIIADFDAIRQSVTLDPAISASLRDGFASLAQNVPSLLTASDVDASFLPTLATSVRDLSGAMDPAVAEQIFGALLDTPPQVMADSYVAPSDVVAANNQIVLLRTQRMVVFAAYTDAIANRQYGARPDAIATRGQLATRLDIALHEVNGTNDADVGDALSDLAGRTVEYLSRTILNLAPVVIVSAPLTMPALWWAQRLYGDAGRADELVARNQVKHPAFMPVQFEALAS